MLSDAFMRFLRVRRMAHLRIEGATYTPIRVLAHFRLTAENCVSISNFLAQPSLDIILWAEKSIP